MMILEHHRKRDPDGFSAKHAPDVLITVGQTRGVAAASDVLPQLKLLLDARVDPNVPGLLETSTSGVTELPLVLCALAALEPRRRAAAPPLRRFHTPLPRHRRVYQLHPNPNPNAGRAGSKRLSRLSRRYSQRVPTRHPLCRPRARKPSASPSRRGPRAKRAA